MSIVVKEAFEQRSEGGEGINRFTDTWEKSIRVVSAQIQMPE